MTTEEFKGKLIGYCFISKDLIYIDNKKAIELINRFKKEVCKEQKIICSNLSFPEVDIIEINDESYIRAKEILNAPEPD